MATDYAGPFQGLMLLIVVDTHAKWVEVKAVKIATSATTTEHLQWIFSTHGLPELLVTDNGDTFISSECKEFLFFNGIRHVTSVPYHPATNGQAERTIQSVKDFLKKPSSEPFEALLLRFLFRYRITPHTTTKVLPTELLMGHHPRSRLDLVLPNPSSHVSTQQDKQATLWNRHTKPRTIEKSNLVYVRQLPKNKDWLPSVVVDACGPLSCEIRLKDDRIVCRHYDHILLRSVSDRSESKSVAGSTLDWVDLPTVRTPPPGPVDWEATEEPPAPPLRHSSRTMVPPDHFVSGL